jgi:hypothetical protein
MPSERVMDWLTGVPPRRSAILAVIGIGFGVATAGFLGWLFLHPDADDARVGQVVTFAVIGLWQGVMGLGSLLPEERGGFAVRSASRWLAIPIGAAFALYLNDIYQERGPGHGLGLLVFVAVMMPVCWFIGRHLNSDW